MNREQSSTDIAIILPFDKHDRDKSVWEEADESKAILQATSEHEATFDHPFLQRSAHRLHNFLSRHSLIEKPAFERFVASTLTHFNEEMCDELPSDHLYTSQMDRRAGSCDADSQECCEQFNRLMNSFLFPSASAQSRSSPINKDQSQTISSLLRDPLLAKSNALDNELCALDLNFAQEAAQAKKSAQPAEAVSGMDLHHCPIAEVNEADNLEKQMAKAVERQEEEEERRFICLLGQYLRLQDFL